MSKTIEIQLNMDLTTPKGRLKKGKMLKLESDLNGLPLDSFWRRRLKDAKFDDCVEVISPKPISKKAKKIEE